MDNDRDWRESPACIAVNNGKAACGAMLVDTGITTMFLTVPEDQAAARAPARAQPLDHAGRRQQGRPLRQARPTPRR